MKPEKSSGFLVDKNQGVGPLLFRRSDHAVFSAEEVDDRSDGLREDFPKVDFVGREQDLLERTHEGILDFGGEVDLDDSVRDRLADLVMRNAGAAVKD